MKAVRVGLLGLGTVGAGTVAVLRRNADEIARRAGRPVEITHAAVRSLTRTRDCPLEGLQLTEHAESLVEHPEIDIICELIGGIEPARSLILRAIAAGKHVVTANKALIASHGNEIFAAAGERGVAVSFEAAVAGGIPIIKSLREGLAGNRITRVTGIINGTSNYVLTAMAGAGRDFDEVLAEAQELGYAEADPSFDVNGTDAAHKLTILASIAFGMPLRYDEVFVEGIVGVSAADVAYAEELGYRVKHLGIAALRDGHIELRAHPTLVPQHKLLANVDGVTNAVMVDSDAVGQSLFYGPGAGAEPTASAVIADLIDLARALTIDADQRVPYLAFHHDRLVDIPVLDITDVETAFYLRMRVYDRPGVLADITRIFGDLGISIEAVLQREPLPEHTQASIILLTRKVREGHMYEALERIERLPAVVGEVTRIRLDHLDD